MRTYGHYCALAKALDVVGDRWTLLIVRELTLQGRCRYTDLRAGLPGIATNLLATRLRELEEAGVIVREQAPPPAPGRLISLTERGRQLRPALEALVDWGVAYIHEGPAPEDAFRGQWLIWPAEMCLGRRDLSGPPFAVELRTPDGAVAVEVLDGHAHVGSPGAAVDATLAGPPFALLGALSGRLAPQPAFELGLRTWGSADAIARLIGSAWAAVPASL